MAKTASVTRTVLADQVKERLLEGILSGAYPPDSRIVETTVAREMQVSQAPVREALRGLEALGVVEITPFRGARVRQPDQQELEDAYAVRCAIEVLGAKLAMPRMTDEDIDELTALAEQMAAAADAEDGHIVAAVDTRFHGRIMELSGNKALTRVWQSLEPFARTYITLVMPGSDPHWTYGLHVPIIDGVRRRDTEAVVRALEDHFDEAQRTLGERMRRSREQAALPADE
ncbi:GntR family transcriptional regulator [Isoptericola sp. b490]|uniref:GntR family transcriptional regulator n=1 Tax=Actinotalea lenta TaxID=3064654 RepID=UPI002713A86E|nr:GntR family transcriptional regulator [Isoptericola sp. b490]MDO8119764.1 GntR family transcriptional regulator [Isoptericola sp. b490]